MKNNKLGLGLLIMLGVGSMIGGGIFNSPTDFINSANPQATMIAWGIGGIGIIFLALVFQMLANKRPNLTGGIFNYANEGFGEFIGFNSAWGYWMSAWIGNVALYILLFKTLDDLVGGISPILSFVLATTFHWTIFFIQTKGIKQAGIINAIVTVMKLIPIALVILIGMMAFDIIYFNVDNWTTMLASKVGTDQMNTSLLEQIKGSMGTILWCFVGIEASVVMSERAKSQKIVGKATIISIVISLSVYIIVTVIGMGVVPAKELASASTPFASILERTPIGSMGGVLVKVGMIISLLGASISWLMLASEIPYVAAKGNVMPKWFEKSNNNGAPINSLFITTVAMQILLFSLLSPQLQNVYSAMSNIVASTILVPYLLSSLYAIKVCKEDKLTFKNKLIAFGATIYSIYVLYAVGLVYLCLSIIIYALGVFAYLKAKKEKKQEINHKQKSAMVIMLIISVIMLVLLIAGKITV